MGVTIEEQKIAQLGNDDAKYRICQSMNATFRTELGFRLRAERDRLKLSQDEMAEAGCVSRRTQAAWERGEQVPNAEYLALIGQAGADVMYVVTAVRGWGGALGTGSGLSEDEQALLDNYRSADSRQRDALLLVAAALASN